MVICKPQHNKQQCQRAYGMEIPRGGLEKAPIAHQNIRQAKIFCILLTCLLSSSMLVGLNSNNYFAFFVEGVMTSENFYMFLCSVRSKDPLLIIRFRQGQKKRWKRKITNLNDWRASIVGCNEQERGDTSPFVWEYTWCVPMPMPIVWVLWGHEIVCDRVRAVSSAQYENVRIYDGCANCCGLCTVQLKVWCSAVQLRAQSMMETRAFVCGQTVLPP